MTYIFLLRTPFIGSQSSPGKPVVCHLSAFCLSSSDVLDMHAAGIRQNKIAYSFVPYGTYGKADKDGRQQQGCYHR